MNTLSLFIVIFLILVGCSLGQDQDDTECISAIMNSINNPDTLNSMILNTGKGINDLGQIDA